MVMEIFDLDPVVAVVMLGMVAGVVELVKRAFDKDWRAAAVIIGAAAAGGITALLMGVNPLFGLVVGFAASGYVTIAQNIGKDSL